MSAQFKRGELLYEGKAKRLYSVIGQPQLILQEFKDSLTAFNAQKLGSFEHKGQINREITALIFRQLEREGISTHLIADLPPNAQVTLRLDMLKAEIVVRNVLAGSTAKKFGRSEGTPLETPLVEFYFKDDALGDPFMSDDQALMMEVVGRREQLDEMRELGLAVNRSLRSLFGRIGIQLVDFKIEAGWSPEGRLVLADEITPDSCRLWDQRTGEKLDKDRFRRDLGGVAEAYKDVHERLCGALKEGKP
jgi:phosphoribosylaminoimidazole-succinocarboxamide synthase